MTRKHSSGSTMPDLTDEEKALLDIEGKAWRYYGWKETAVREATGMSMTRAMQELNRLIDTEAALAYAPATVNRLLRLRKRRQLSRSARRA